MKFLRFTDPQNVSLAINPEHVVMLRHAAKGEMPSATNTVICLVDGRSQAVTEDLETVEKMLMNGA